MAKKKAKKLKNTRKVNNDNVAFNYIKLILVVSILFLIFYLVTLFINKDDKKDTESTEVEIQYDTILMGNVLNQPKENYYVLIKSSDDLANGLYETFAAKYKTVNNYTRIYYVELNNRIF